MLENEFHKPTFLNPRVEILGDRVVGGQTVRAELQQVIDSGTLKPGGEVATEHFYIKEVPEAEDIMYLPGYDVWVINSIVGAMKSLEKEGKTQTAEEIESYFEREKG